MTNILTAIIKTIDYTVPVFCIKAMAFVTGFFLIATIFANLYVVLYQFIFSKKYGYRLKFICLFGLVFTQKDNKWIKILYKPFPICATIPLIDSNNIQQDYLEKEKQLTFSERYSKLLLSIVLFALTLKPIIALFNGESLSFIEWFLVGFSTGMIFHSLSHIRISKYIYNKLYKGILGYIHDKTELVRKDGSYKNLDLKPIEELPYKSPSEMEKIYYYLFYCSYLLSLNKNEEIKKVSLGIADILWKKDFNIINCLCNYLAYYWLVFYYSEIEPDKEKADNYFKTIEPFLTNDEESNARRVLAYYYYKLYNDTEKAKNLIEEGLARIDKFDFEADRNLERNLLLKLKNEIELNTNNSNPITPN